MYSETSIRNAILSLTLASLLTAVGLGIVNMKIPIALAQQQKQIPNSSSIGVRITSPSKGQEVQTNEDLPISGTSTSNANMNCKVSIKVNEARPYQPVTASGPNGADDYSQWSFLLTSDYTSINEGPNKIVAKLSCDPSGTEGVGEEDDDATTTTAAGLNKWYSVNVTGVETD